MKLLISYQRTLQEIEKTKENVLKLRKNYENVLLLLF